MYLIKRLTALSAICLSAVAGFSQARFILNDGGIVNLNGGNAATSIYLVIDNPAVGAITRINSGHIISEGEYNKIKWNIGVTPGTYTIPYGIGAATYIPQSITTSGAAGASGTIIFSTYPTATWLNSADMPAGMLHVNSYLGLDNSYSVIDRFWRIEAQNYTTKPALSNMEFTYRDIEHSVASNSITEANLVAQRYNDVTHEWGDFLPGGTDNTTTNEVYGAVAPNSPTPQLYTWWTLVDFQSPLPIELTAFNAECAGSLVSLNWKTASEHNNSYFSIERSADAQQFETIGRVSTRDGNSQLPQSYAFSDPQPLNGIAYYRLRQVDADGQFSYSAMVRVTCSGGTSAGPLVSIYPNPATEFLNVGIKNLPGSKQIMLFDLLGQLLATRTEADPDVIAWFRVSELARAAYVVRIDVDGEFFQAIKFVKD